MSFKATLVLVAAIAMLAPVRTAPTLQARHEGHDDSYGYGNDTPSATSSILAASSVSASVSVSVSAAPVPSATRIALPASYKDSAVAAQKLNAGYKKLNETDECQTGESACIASQFASCIDSKWVLSPCALDLKCYAVPFVDRAGTGLSCTTEKDALLRIAVAGVEGGTTGEDPVEDDDDCDHDDDDDQDDDCDDDGDDYDDDVPPSTSTSTSASITSAPVPSTTSPSGAITSTIGSITVPLDNVAFTTVTVNKRQLPTEVTSSASVSVTESTSAIPSASSTFAVTSSSASPAVITPTVVIGADGIVTVTVVSVSVSTTTVSASLCEPTIATTPLPVTVSRAQPSGSLSGILATVRTSFASSSTSVVSSSVPVATETVSSSSSPSTVVVSPSTTSSPVVSTQTQNPFTFRGATSTFTTGPSEPTPFPSNPSELLTATIS